MILYESLNYYYYHLRLLNGQQYGKSRKRLTNGIDSKRHRLRVRMPRKPLFFSQIEEHMLQGYVNEKEGVYVLIGDLTYFGIQLSVNPDKQYEIASTSTIPP